MIRGGRWEIAADKGPQVGGTYLVQITGMKGTGRVSFDRDRPDKPFEQVANYIPAKHNVDSTYTAAGLQCPVATLARAWATPANPTLWRAWLRLGEDISNWLQHINNMFRTQITVCLASTALYGLSTDQNKFRCPNS